MTRASWTGSCSPASALRDDDPSARAPPRLVEPPGSDPAQRPRREGSGDEAFRTRTIAMTLTAPPAAAAYPTAPRLPFEIVPETPRHQLAIEDLHAHVFGPGRFARTAYRVRGRHGHDRDLSFVALLDGEVAGGVWQTRVWVGAEASILLGPLAVRPDLAGKGCGLVLLKAALAAAEADGAKTVVLVGDAPYYARVGFTRIPHGKIGWPGPVDPARVLGVAFEAGAIDALSGPIQGGRRKPEVLDLPALAIPGHSHAAE